VTPPGAIGEYQRNTDALRREMCGLITAVDPGDDTPFGVLDGTNLLLYYDLTVPCGAVFFALVCAVTHLGKLRSRDLEIKGYLKIE
jgi:hypothetical protein